MTLFTSADLRRSTGFANRWANYSLTNWTVIYMRSTLCANISLKCHFLIFLCFAGSEGKREPKGMSRVAPSMIVHPWSKVVQGSQRSSIGSPWKSMVVIGSPWKPKVVHGGHVRGRPGCTAARCPAPRTAQSLLTTRMTHEMTKLLNMWYFG